MGFLKLALVDAWERGGDERNNRTIRSGESSAGLYPKCSFAAATGADAEFFHSLES
jgi:hypothetical protein